MSAVRLPGIPQVTLHEIYQLPDLPVRKPVAKRDHSIPAFGNVLVYLRIGFVLKFALTKVGYHGAVGQRSTLGFGAVANGAVLTE